jgi:membrane-associated PAP2 superfamily phosphatase
MAASAMAIHGASYLFGDLRAWRMPCFFVLALIVFGPGLMVNSVLKPNFARPKPGETKEFGGYHDFHPVGQPGASKINRSFPSGHAAMGFALIAPAFVLYPHRRLWAAVFVVVGCLTGGLVGGVRITQGGHFLSDVIWSLGTVYFSGLFLAMVFDVVRDRRIVAQLNAPAAIARDETTNGRIPPSASAR